MVHGIHSRLHVCGTTIRDAWGREVRLLSIQDSVVTPPYSFVDIARWGFNTVRLQVPWHVLEPTRPTIPGHGHVVHHWNERFLQDLDRVVNGFGSHGVAVILAMAQHLWSPAFTNLVHGPLTFESGAGMPAWLYPKGGGLCAMVRAEKSFFIHGRGQSYFRAALQFLARRYADNPAVVGVDILNEPYDILSGTYPCIGDATPQSMKLARFYERTGRAIHSVNPHVLLIVEAKRAASTGRWSLTRRPEIPNSVLAIHLYAKSWEDGGRSMLSGAYQRAVEWSGPLWIGEWTMYNRTTDLFPPWPGWEESATRTLAYCKEHGIGWSILGYGPGSFQTHSDPRMPKPSVLSVVRSGF